MQHNIGIAVTQRPKRKLDLYAAQYQLSIGHKPVQVRTDTRAIFVLNIVAHSIPFVLGTSVPVILTAVAIAWPNALKMASAIW